MGTLLQLKAFMKLDPQLRRFLVRGSRNEILIDVDAALYVDVEDYNVPFSPDALHFAFQSTVVRTLINLLVFYECTGGNLLQELFLAQEVVILSVHFCTPRLTGGGRYREFEVGEFGNQVLDHSGLA